MSAPAKLGTLFLVPTFTEEQLTEMDRELERHEAELVAELEADRQDQRKGNLERERALRLPDADVAGLVSGNLLETVSLSVAQEWFTNPARKPCLVLAGGTGCGKSLAAAWALAEIGGVWMGAPRVERVFAASFGESYAEQERARNAALLVVDDAGTEDSPQRFERALIELLDARNNRRYRTILTTNLAKHHTDPKKSFVGRYPSDRLRSRMQSLSQWSTSGGPDLRRAP